MFCCTQVQYVFLRHISYVFILYKQPHKPSHITQAYQNVPRDPIVEHKDRSIRKISLKNQYIWLKGSCTTGQQKNRVGPINLEKAIFQNADEEYHVKVAETLQEACKLLEVGFEYVTDLNGQSCLGKESSLIYSKLIFYCFDKAHHVPELNPCVRRHVGVLKNLV